MTTISLTLVGIAAMGGWYWRAWLAGVVDEREWIPPWLVHGRLPDWRARLARWRELSPRDQVWLDEWMGWLAEIKEADALREAAEQAAAARRLAERSTP